jgi:glycerol uptake facilitator-like aquaporin
MDKGMRALLAEFFGAFVLLFFGGLSILSSGGDLIVIGFGFGLALLAGLYCVWRDLGRALQSRGESRCLLGQTD